MDRNYILILSCGSAALLVIAIIIVLVVVKCRKKNACCKKFTTSSNFTRTASESSVKHIRISELNRETHLIDNDVAFENFVSSFQTETLTVANENNKSAEDSRGESQKTKQECDKESGGEENDTIEKTILEKPTNKMGDDKKKTDKYGLDGCDNFALTVENDGKETTVHTKL